MSRPGPLRLSLFLALGIAAVSSGSIFIRLASAPALTVAAYRVFWATLLLAPAVIRSPVRELVGLTRKEWYQLLFSGMALAFHFAFWIASLSYTSVASSVLLVNTTPFFVGLVSQWILRRPCSRFFWIGLGIAFLGCAVIFHKDWTQTGVSLKGNTLAVLGAIAIAVYLLVGAQARQRLSLLAYVWPVYGAAALALIAACLIFSSPLLGFSPRTYLFMFLVGLVPQCVGHTTYNWSLRWLPPALVALLGLSEPVGASLLAFLILHESIAPIKLIGGGIVLLGIYLAARTEMKRQPGK